MNVHFNLTNYNRPVNSANRKCNNVTFGLNSKIAVQAGTFDPYTLGHRKVTEIYAGIFDKIIVLIAKNPNKTPRFPLDVREQFIKEAVKDLPNVEVDHYDGLTVDYAIKHDAGILLRGIRPTIKDFQDEVELNKLNEKQSPEVKTLYLLSSSVYEALSSSVVRKLMDLNQFDAIKKIVPPFVYEYMVQQYQNK